MQRVVVIGAGVVGASAAYRPHEGWADGPLLVRTLVAAARALGPEGDGRVVRQDGATDALVNPSTPRDPTLPACRELWRRASAYLSGLVGAGIVEARVGIRALPADGYPIIGFAHGCPGLYLAVTHSGMTLGPLLGELIAAEALGQARDPRLATFRPERCVGRC
jgi:glycine/D-amino acid oxidase-like deaminating enzyme